MKIIRFRVKNYKSIRDSGYCYLEDKVTILAGKNESGKSSLLEALADFNVDAEVNSRALPIQYEEQEESIENQPSIEIEFSLSNDDIQKILENASTEIADINNFPKTIVVTKNYNDEFIIHENFFQSLGIESDINFDHEIKRLYSEVFTKSIKSISTTLGIVMPTYSWDQVKDFHTLITNYKSIVAANIAHIPAADQALLQSKLNELIDMAKDAIENTPQTRAKLTNSILNSIPNFILFSSFDDIFPNEIPFEDLKTNKWIIDLSKITNLSIETITGNSDRSKIRHKSKINTDLNNDFSQYWSQDFSELEVEWDNKHLTFWIKEGEQYYEPAQRSQGRRWHLAFYVRVSARSREDINNIILIDEPGLYLHATAQKDILNKLEHAGENSQIIFSTHSPYLIEHDKLGRIRLVIKDTEAGTIVENKLHKVSDKETLTPILSAIGMELNQGITNPDKINNVIVEGMSDYYYLTAFKNILKVNDMSFVFGGGAGNMPKIGMILHGWGCNVMYLYDNDKAYQDALKNIKKEWLTTTRNELSTLPVNGSIEDVFSKNDFSKYVLQEIEPKNSTQEKNSEFMKNNDKVLKAKKFCEQVCNGGIPEFESETTNLITKLFDSIQDHFNHARAQGN